MAPQIAPDGSAVHLASEPEPLQLRHLSAQAVPQQAPSTQKPDLHSWLLLHATPASFCGKHDSSPSQYAPAGQIKSPAGHPLLHTPASMLQPKGAQLTAAGVLHIPTASHVAAGVKVSPTQVALAQSVPAGQRVQPPEPSHFPVRPQVAGDSCGQLARGSALPAAIGTQIPTEPGSAHERHGPVHACVQQTPSTQIAELQSLDIWQAAPAGSFCATVPPVPALPVVPALPLVPALPVVPAPPLAPVLPLTLALPVVPAAPFMPAIPLAPALPCAPEPSGPPSA